MYRQKLTVIPENLNRNYQQQQQEIIDEEYKTLPSLEAIMEARFVRDSQEINKPPTRLEQKTAFTINLFINNIAEEVNRALELTSVVLENPDFEKLDISRILSDWNKLVVYIKSWEKHNNISVKDYEIIWNRLNDEVLPNLSQLILEGEMVIEERDFPIFTKTEKESLLMLEELIRIRQFTLIKGVSRKAREAAETRERELRRPGEKDAKIIENYISKGGLENREEVLKRAFSPAEIQQIEQQLIDIKNITDENQRKNLTEDLERQIINRLSRESSQFFGDTLRKFKDQLKKLDEAGLMRLETSLKQQRRVAQDEQDADRLAMATQRLTALENERIERDNLDFGDIYGDDAAFYGREEGDSEFGPSTSELSLPTGTTGSVENIWEERPRGRRGRPRGRPRGSGRSFLSRNFDKDNRTILGRNSYNRVHLPYNDLDDDPYLTLKKMNIH